MAAIQIGREDVPPPRTPMAHPARNASPMAILSSTRVFFVTTKTSMTRRLLQSERNAVLLIDVLRSNVAAGKFQLHDFVIMPDHLRLLMTLPVDFTIEKAMQLINADFSEVRIRDGQSFLEHRDSIVRNPVKAGLVDSAEQYPYCFTYLARKKAQGLKPKSFVEPERPD